MTCGIYKITNKQNSKFYLGSSKSIEKRWGRHRQDLIAGNHHNIHLQRAWSKYGQQSFVFEVVEEVEETNLLNQEQRYLNELNACDPQVGYNIGRHSSGGDNLSCHPLKGEIIKKRSESLRRFLENLSEEEKRARSDKLKGDGNPNFGKRWSSDQRLKMSRYRTGRRFETESIEKIKINSLSMWANPSFKAQRISEMTGEGNSFYGKSHSETSKKKLRASAIERWNSLSEQDRSKRIPHMRPVCAAGVTFPSLTAAAKELGVVRETIAHRIRSKNPKFSNYHYLE